VSTGTGRVSRGAPLEGIRVLDLTRVLAGPLCTMTLGDLGADVVKVERPGGGDDTRHWGPPFVGDDAAYYLSINRNKRSIELDLGTPEDATVARSLALGADVLVENFRPGLLRRFDLHHEALAAENPRLVSCSITAFGARRDAPPGYDIIVQAMSGLMSITGEPEGEPTKVGVALVDVISGLQAAIGILAALQERERSGRGQHLEISLFDASVAALVNQAANYLLGSLVPGRLGNQHPNIVPYQTFRASDAPFVLAAGNDRMFAATCAVVGRPELATDERFATNGARVRHRDELIALLAVRFAERPAAEWIERLEAARVPCSPIPDLADVFGSAAGRAMVEEVPDPERGTLRLPRSPLVLSETPVRTRRPPPRLGEHSAEIRDELEGWRTLGTSPARPAGSASPNHDRA
jgi:crotonobetainyl-CoA:carnitine CoA-transferase CaiB-like acyl-CoA transferase